MKTVIKATKAMRIKSTTTPILHCVHFKDGTATITNLDMWLVLDSEVTGEHIIDCDDLETFASGGYIDEKDPADYPVLNPGNPESTTIHVPLDALVGASLCASDDKARREPLTYVRLRDNTITATDSYKAVRILYSGKTFPETFIPKEGITVIRKLAKKNTDVLVQKLDGMMIRLGFIATDGHQATLYTKIRSFAYPNIDSIYTRYENDEVIYTGFIDVGEWSKIAKLASKESIILRSNGKQGLAYFKQGPDPTMDQWITEESGNVDCRLPRLAGASSLYLSIIDKMMKTISANRIFVNITGKSSPITIYSDSQYHVSTLLMPVRVR